MSLKVLLNINNIITNGFAETGISSSKIARNNGVVSFFLPTMEKIVKLFVMNDNTLIYDELMSYAYIAASTAVNTYTREDGNFIDFVSGYIIFSLNEVTKVNADFLEEDSIIIPRICDADSCIAISPICLESICSNLSNDNKELLIHARNILTNLNDSDALVLNSIISGEINDPKQFSINQTKTLVKLKKELLILL